MSRHHREDDCEQFREWPRQQWLPCIWLFEPTSGPLGNLAVNDKYQNNTQSRKLPETDKNIILLEYLSPILAFFEIRLRYVETPPGKIIVIFISHVFSCLFRELDLCQSLPHFFYNYTCVCTWWDGVYRKNVSCINSNLRCGDICKETV